jgi:hypothetical protein
MQGNYLSFDKTSPNRFFDFWSFIGTAVSNWAVMVSSKMIRGRTIQLIALLLGLPVFIYSTLALAQVGHGASCHWAFPKWFGCVLSAHEGLAGGLIGASGALIAAWIAWSAVQQQINAERERATADRVEAERLLSEDLPDYADAMAAAWRLLAEIRHQRVNF